MLVVGVGLEAFLVLLGVDLVFTILPPGYSVFADHRPDGAPNSSSAWQEVRVVNSQYIMHKK